MIVHAGVRVGFAMAALVVVASEAHAQTADRSGFLIGISLPLGGKLVRENNVSGDQTLLILADEGRDLFSVGGEMQLGWALARRVAALGTFALDVGVEDSAPAVPDISASLRVEGRTADIVADDHSTSSTILAGNVQYWLNPSLWIRGGLGAATLSRDLIETSSGAAFSVDKGFSPAVIAGVGIKLELPRIPPFDERIPPFEIQFRYSTYSVDGMRVQIASVFLGSILR